MLSPATSTVDTDLHRFAPLDYLGIAGWLRVTACEPIRLGTSLARLPTALHDEENRTEVTTSIRRSLLRMRSCSLANWSGTGRRIDFRCSPFAGDTLSAESQ